MTEETIINLFLALFLLVVCATAAYWLGYAYGKIAKEMRREREKRR